MGFVFLLVIFYLAYRNGVIAKRKGKSLVAWTVITIVSYFVAEMVAMCIVMFGFFGLTADKLLSYGNNAQALTNDFSNFLMEKPIHWTFIMAFSFGGYLLVRFILERMPSVNNSGSKM